MDDGKNRQIAPIFLTTLRNIDVTGQASGFNLFASELGSRECEALGNMKVRAVIKLIKADGWFWVRTKGDHRQYHHRTKPGTVTVAGKPSDEVPPGTLNSILRQAGLKGN